MQSTFLSSSKQSFVRKLFLHNVSKLLSCQTRRRYSSKKFSPVSLQRSVTRSGCHTWIMTLVRCTWRVRRVGFSFAIQGDIRYPSKTPIRTPATKYFSYRLSVPKFQDKDTILGHIIYGRAWEPDVLHLELVLNLVRRSSKGVPILSGSNISSVSGGVMNIFLLRYPQWAE